MITSPTESFAKKVRLNPEDAARDLAEQHFNEALDMLQENARQTLTEVLYDDLRLSMRNDEFEAFLTLYTARISDWIKATPTTLEGEDA